MATPRSSTATDFFGISKTACKAYKSLVTKLHPHSSHRKSESHSDADSTIHRRYLEEKFAEEDDLIAARRGLRLQSMDDSSVFKRRSSLLSSTSARRSHTPQAKPTYLSSSSSSNRRSAFSRNTSRRDDSSSHGGRSRSHGLKTRPTSTNPSPKTSPKVKDQTQTLGDFFGPLQGLSSPPSSSPINGVKLSPSSVSKNSSKRDKDSSKNGSKRDKDDTGSISKTRSKRDKDDRGSSVWKSVSKRDKDDRGTSTSFSKISSKRHSEKDSGGSMGKSVSRRSTTPIVFSQSTPPKKPAAVERKLECTLEELCHGGVKNIKITRDIITDEGLIKKQEETLRVNIKPGWKKGTKITFEGVGNEKLGYLPEDITFVVEEKKHPLFKRRGDDLEIAVEIPLLKALTGCKLSVPLLSGDTMSVSVGEVIFHGFEKAIAGQGLPNAKEEGKRGDLRITFLVNFPKELSAEQRSIAYEVLKDCSWA